MGTSHPRALPETPGRRRPAPRQRHMEEGSRPRGRELYPALGCGATAPKSEKRQGSAASGCGQDPAAARVARGGGGGPQQVSGNVEEAQDTTG